METLEALKTSAESIKTAIKSVKTALNIKRATDGVNKPKKDSVLSRFASKVAESKAGQTIKSAAKKVAEGKIGKAAKSTYKVLSHPTVTRAASLITASVMLGGAAIASGGIAIPAAAMALAAANVTRSTYKEFKNIKEKQNIIKEQKFLSDAKSSAKTIEGHAKLAEKFEIKAISADDGKDKKSKITKEPKKNSVLKAFGKSVGESSLEIAGSLAVAIASANPVSIGLTASHVVLGLSSDTAKKHLEQEAKKQIKDQINEDKKQVPGYDNIKELGEKALDMKATAQALDKISKMESHEQNNDNFNKFKTEALAEIKQEEPYSKLDQSTVQKIKNNVKQFAKMVNPFSKDKEPSYKDIAEGKHLETKEKTKAPSATPEKSNKTNIDHGKDLGNLHASETPTKQTNKAIGH